MTETPESDPEEDLFRPAAVAVRLVLARNAWSQARLAAAAGIHQSQLSNFQLGRRTPSRETLEKLAAAVGWPLPFVERLASAVIRHREQQLGRGSTGPVPLPEVAAEIGRRAALATEEALAEIERLLEVETGPGVREPSAADRAAADDLWRRLEDLDDEERRGMI